MKHNKDDRRDNVERIQYNIDKTIDNYRKAQDMISETSDNKMKDTLIAKNERRLQALDGMREEMKDESAARENGYK